MQLSEPVSCRDGTRRDPPPFSNTDVLELERRAGLCRGVTPLRHAPARQILRPGASADR
jgi:hypothetical protein